MVMEIDTIGNVLVGVFELEAVVGLVVLAIVIVDARTLGRRGAASDPPSGKPQEPPEPPVRDLVFVLVVVGFFLLAALFVRVCEAIVGPQHEQVDE